MSIIFVLTLFISFLLFILALHFSLWCYVFTIATIRWLGNGSFFFSSSFFFLRSHPKAKTKTTYFLLRFSMIGIFFNGTVYLFVFSFGFLMFTSAELLWE